MSASAADVKIGRFKSSDGGTESAPSLRPGPSRLPVLVERLHSLPDNVRSPCDTGGSFWSSSGRVGTDWGLLMLRSYAAGSEAATPIPSSSTKANLSTLRMSIRSICSTTSRLSSAGSMACTSPPCCSLFVARSPALSLPLKITTVTCLLSRPGSPPPASHSRR